MMCPLQIETVLDLSCFNTNINTQKQNKHVYVLYYLDASKFSIKFTMWKLVLHGSSLLFPRLPTSHLFFFLKERKKNLLFGRHRKKKRIKMKNWNKKLHDCTLALPNARVKTQYKTWKTANTKMNICSWWIPPSETNGTLPWIHIYINHR